MLKIGCVYETVILFLMCCIHRAFLNETTGWSTLGNSDKQNTGTSAQILMKMNESKSNNLYFAGDIILENSLHMENRSAMGSGHRQHKESLHRNRNRRSTYIISSSRPSGGVFSSTQRSDIQNVRIKKAARQSDSKWTNASKSGVKPVIGAEEAKLADPTYQQQNISTAINMTLLNIYEQTLRRRRDVRSATFCLSAVIILLVAVVLYSRMWQRRTQWRTLDDVLNEQYARSELPQHGKVSLQDLLEKKLSFIKAQFKKFSSRHYDSVERGQYKELINTEISETEPVYS